jgi:hypothetical protein
MAFKCLECGHIFEDGEQVVWRETHGLDTPPYESFSGCPLCKGAYEETRRCKICGGEFLEEELNGDLICDECIDQYREDFDTCYKIAKQDQQEVKINGLLAALFDAREIEIILLEIIKKDNSKVDCSNYIERNKNWFVEKLVEEVKK